MKGQLRGHAPVPPLTDGLPVGEHDPAGWHVRETTETGYPLMGSSPAERADSVSRQARIAMRAMRDHEFVGQGRYCQAWLGPVSRGGPEIGVITTRMGCGYPRDTHPEPEPEALIDEGEGLLC